jgi:hypothetical protein
MTPRERIDAGFGKVDSAFIIPLLSSGHCGYPMLSHLKIVKYLPVILATSVLFAGSAFADMVFIDGQATNVWQDGRIFISATKRTLLGKMDLILISIESVQIQAPVYIAFQISRRNKLLRILIQPRKDEGHRLNSAQTSEHRKRIGTQTSNHRRPDGFGA